MAQPHLTHGAAQRRGASFVLALSHSDRPRRLTGQDRRRRHILGDDASRRHDGISPYRDATENHRARGQPRAVLDFDRTSDEIECLPSMVVAAGADINLLRDADVAAERHVGQIIDPGFLPDPAMVSSNKAAMDT